MSSKYLLLFSFFICSKLFSQGIYERYPDNQTNYIGGNVKFYKDFHQVLIDKKLQPCENKNEILHFKVVVYPDKKIKYVKSEDAEENKCTFELAKEVAKYLTGWNPAVIDGNNVAALTGFYIVPHYLFQNFKEGYDAENETQNATYEGGLNNFRKKVFQGINVSGFKFTGILRLKVTFVIETDGKLTNVELVQSSGLKEFDEMIVRSISQIRNKWTPAKIHGLPVKYHFRLPLAFSME